MISRQSSSGLLGHLVYMLRCDPRTEDMDLTEVTDAIERRSAGGGCTDFRAEAAQRVRLWLNVPPSAST